MNNKPYEHKPNEVSPCKRSSGVKVPGKLSRDYHCDALNTHLTKYSRRIRRAIDRMLGPLSDIEDQAACAAICFFLSKGRPIPRVKGHVYQPYSDWQLLSYRFTKGFTLLREAEIAAMLAPMYLRLSPVEDPLPIALYRAIQVDISNTHTSSGHWVKRTFPKQRVDILNGSIMASAAPYFAIKDEDMEWFGSNRDSISPVWGIMVDLGIFDPSRVGALIEHSSEAPISLLEGAL